MDDDIYDICEGAEQEDEVERDTQQEQVQVEVPAVEQQHMEEEDPVATNDDEDKASTDYDSDEMESGCGSDDDEETPKYTLYKEPAKPQEKPILKLGMKFVDAKQFRKALRRHAVLSGYDIQFNRNDGDRVTCVCKMLAESLKEGKTGCQWRIHASWSNIEAAFMIKTYNPTHTCSKVFENKQATSTIISDMYMENLRDDPDWRLSAIQKAVNRELGIDVSVSKIYNAKKKAKTAIEGDFVEQYSWLWDYSNILSIRNPGTVVKMQVERPNLDEKPTFQRFFVSYGAWIEGFKSGCRKLIGLDGCFLKGSFGGQLLSAVGRDANNGMFPVAIAVVEAETTNSWTWFLNKLVEALGSVEENGWCFISDRQKGLSESFEVVMPNAHHRYCLRHLYANLKANGFKNLKLKEEMWSAASSFTKEGFEQHMSTIKNENLAAYEYLIKIDPSQWARSHFDPQVKCELLWNNLSESWNHFILKARDRPILTMLEMIRRLVMKRIQVCSSKMARHEGVLCPKIQSKLEQCKEQSRNCQPIYAGQRQFEVLSFNTYHAVDLDQRSCSCKKWDYTGIPCCHAVAAIWKMKLKPEDFVDDCFHKQTYLRSYKPIMRPLIDRSLWPKTGHEPVLPPILRNKPGRPKKKRKRGADEGRQSYKLSRASASLKCRKCHQYGHNTRTCKGAPVGEGGSHKTTRPVKAKGGRPKNDENEAALPVGRGGPVKRGGALFRKGVSVRGRGSGVRGRGRGESPDLPRGASPDLPRGASPDLPRGASIEVPDVPINPGFPININRSGLIAWYNSSKRTPYDFNYSQSAPSCSQD
ncbi:hypothetical protein CASFOL_016386 [Castilleja foliolosa]|uniref:SWIM-type domain-containing protein n=1 Tax=Castilleja foliolosa TaxID=1961234 RepID=A0ABD3DH17_9LAMI